jgi:formylglycine-generating enzyme required for sulfatase activity/serine/threonine protein kinase
MPQDPPQELLPRGAAAPASSDPVREVIERLASRNAASTRYQMRGEVARGGMGAILRIWDEDLHRDLAMKVILGYDGAPVSATKAGADARLIARFLDEAQVTGQLDHPGIVPVHELGLDPQGRIYFTMRLVAGRNLEKIFALVAKGEEGWTRTRAVGAILKICEALAYAHDKGVIHRDLKPANVMVGQFGEVYVMDWGVARVLGRDEPVSPGPRDASAPRRTHSMHITQRGPSGTAVAQPTMEGDIVGTPTYMSPEQARGDLQAIGPASDIYAVGAILYCLLAGHAPHSPPGAARDAIEIWRRAKLGVVEPLHERAPDAPAELVAICEKAMARDPGERYASMLGLAEDLRAYLEGRVVRAYETGAVAEFRKWVARNKALAATASSAVLIIVMGSAIAALVLARKNEQLTTSEHAARISETKAQQNAAIAEERATKILRLSDVKRLSELAKAAELLWPARPDMVERFEGWLADAQRLATRLPDHRRALDEIRARAAPGTKWMFASPEDRWQHDVQQELVEQLTKFSSPNDGLIADVARRLEFARTVAERTVSGESVRARWAEAIASISDRNVCPLYQGLKITPQLGLVPIGRDAHSGLWEFAHLQTGAAPLRDAQSGELALEEDCGIVFVLVPGGTFSMGAQARDSARPNFDPQARDNEGPVNEVTLDPFFISKYEMTQGQWLRFTGNNPSLYRPGLASNVDGTPHTLLNPVEQVSWEDCEQVLARLDLVLPTEAQWEYAARAGTTTPWSTGAKRDSLEGAANLADQAAQRAGANWPGIADWPELDDGFSADAPVDALRPNPFGLHNVHGNVWEWCRDLYAPNYEDALEGGEGERTSGDDRWRVNRGGGFLQSAAYARSAYRSNSAPNFSINHLGVRPARRLAQ